MASIDLENDDLNPIVIHSYLNKESPQWKYWVPETIFSFFNNKVSDVNKHKLLAIQTVARRITLDVQMFENACTAFSGELPIIDVLDPNSMGQICFGKKVITTIDPLWEPSEDIIIYINTIMKNDGFEYNPWFDLGNKSLESKWKKISQIPIDKLKDIEWDDNNAQLEKLTEVRIYIHAKMNG